MSCSPYAWLLSPSGRPSMPGQGRSFRPELSRLQRRIQVTETPNPTLPGLSWWRVPIWSFPMVPLMLGRLHPSSTQPLVRSLQIHRVSRLAPTLSTPCSLPFTLYHTLPPVTHTLSPSDRRHTSGRAWPALCAPSPAEPSLWPGRW